MSKLFLTVMDNEQKKKIEEILATFDKDSKDEMGLMSITIALSSLMFPGTNVLHTRLRYIYLVGWIFLEAMKSNQKLSKKLLHKKEKELRKILQIGKEKNKDLSLGILGSTKPIDKDGEGDELSQPPFNVYFNLLKEWNIILDKNLSAEELHRDAFCPNYLKIMENNFKNDTFILNKKETTYILKQIPNSILSIIFTDDLTLENQHFINYNTNKINNKDQQELFKTAQNFSVLMWGTMLYYDYYLGNENITDKFDIWISLINEVIESKWKPADILKCVDKASTSQENFINSWFNYVEININSLSLKNHQI